MIYVHSFTVIKSTGVRISAPGTGGIPSNPTTKHSLIYFKNSIPKGTTYTTLRFLDLTDFNEHKCILIKLMILILKTIPLDCNSI
jgi:hypothetical protein